MAKPAAAPLLLSICEFCIVAAGEVFTTPLYDGKMASIPYPMSEQTWDLCMQTLTLWKPRLVAAAERTSEG